MQKNQPKALLQAKRQRAFSSGVARVRLQLSSKHENSRPGAAKTACNTFWSFSLEERMKSKLLVNSYDWPAIHFERKCGQCLLF